MKELALWDSIKELNDFSNRLSGFFDKRGDELGSYTRSNWAPLVDITEDAKGYQIKAELPDIDKKDIKVTLERGVLTITGERKYENEQKDAKVHLLERAYGSFARSFTLPEDANGEQISAEFKNGVLHIQVLKSEAAKPKQIEVKVN